MCCGISLYVVLCECCLCHVCYLLMLLCLCLPGCECCSLLVLIVVCWLALSLLGRVWVPSYACAVHCLLTSLALSLFCQDVSAITCSSYSLSIDLSLTLLTSLWVSCLSCFLYADLSCSVSTCQCVSAASCSSCPLSVNLSYYFYTRMWVLLILCPVTCWPCSVSACQGVSTAYHLSCSLLLTSLLLSLQDVSAAPHSLYPIHSNHFSLCLHSKACEC